MATNEWQKPREAMEREAIAALAELSTHPEGGLPPADAASLAIVTANQVPELVDLGAFTPGDLDDEALAAMAIVVDVAAGWDDEAESLAEYVDSLDEHDLTRLSRAAPAWAQAVWTQMVPLSEAEKETTLASLKRH